MKKILMLLSIIIYANLAQATDNEKTAVLPSYGHTSVFMNEDFFSNRIALENLLLKKETKRQKKIIYGLTSALGASVVIIFTGLIVYFEIIR